MATSKKRLLISTRERLPRLPRKKSLPRATEPRAAPSASAEARTAEPKSGPAGRLEALLNGVSIERAVALGTVLDRALSDVCTEHGALVRETCDVPDSGNDLIQVVECTFLGHIVARLEARHGRPVVERIVGSMLDQFVSARLQVTAIMGARLEQEKAQ